MTHLIDGIKWASESRAQTAQEAQYLIAKGIEPMLVVVLVGENSASLVYVRPTDRYHQNISLTNDLVDSFCMRMTNSNSGIGL